jgi:hypothetical protein
MGDFNLQQIEADISEIERLMTELRLKIAVSQSAGEEATESERRLQDMLKGWMLLQDQKATETSRRCKIAGQTTPNPLRVDQAASAGAQGDPAVHR